MPALARRDRRALLLGLLVAAPVLLLALVARPYFGALGEARSRLDAERALLARERALVEAADGLRLAGSGSRDAIAVRTPGLFPGDETLAGGALIRYVADAARTSEVLLQSSETRGVDAVAGGLRALRMEVRATGDLEGILELLHQLETGPRLVHVERLSLEARGSPGFAPGLDDVLVLTLGATVTGYTLSGSAPLEEGE